jgi:methionyl aminopeptidase
MDKEKIIKAGKITAEVKEFAKSFIKKGMLLKEIAEKIEDKIRELGAEPAFPTNLSINEIAAHYTPSHDDEAIANGLLKVDFGSHIDGYLSDTAFSLDLENNNENKKLIETAKKALANATKLMKAGVSTKDIGKEIERTILSATLHPIVNLSGHSMEKYDLHAGITIPNIADGKEEILQKGLYAIEPFVTAGSGRVHDGKPSGIYSLTNSKNVRNPQAREILTFIIDQYGTLPFCERWIVNKFDTKALFALKQLEANNNLHQFPRLVETSNKKVAQAENTILIDDEVIVTTELS